MKQHKLIKDYTEKNKLNIEQVFNEYSGYIYTIIKNLSNQEFNQEDIEEMMSDVFFVLWKNVDRMNENDKISSYLAGVTNNVIKKKKRKIKSNYNIEDYENILQEHTKIDEIYENQNKIEKMIATFVLAVGLSTSIVFAGTMIYEKIFKEPQKYESYEELIQEYSKKQGSQEVIQEDKNKAVNIEGAIIEANNFLNKLGYENQEFVIKELKKNYVLGAELVYYFATDKNLNKGIQVGINAENGKCVSFNDNNLSYSGFQPDKINKDEATKIADKIFNLFDLEENRYKVNEIIEPPCLSINNEESSAVWIVTYYKVYGEALNQFL